MRFLFIPLFICSSLFGMEQPEQQENEPLRGLPIEIKAEIVDYLISDPQYYDPLTNCWHWRKAAAQVRPLLCCCKKYYEQDEVFFHEIVSKLAKKANWTSDYVWFQFSTAISKKYLKNPNNREFYNQCALLLHGGVPGTVTLFFDLAPVEKKEWFRKEGILFAIASDLSLAKVRFFLSKGADINATDTNNNNALHELVRTANESNLELKRKQLKVLLEHTIDLERRNKDGKTALELMQDDVVSMHNQVYSLYKDLHGAYADRKTERLMEERLNGHVQKWHPHFK